MKIKQEDRLLKGKLNRLLLDSKHEDWSGIYKIYFFNYLDKNMKKTIQIYPEKKGGCFPSIKDILSLVLNSENLFWKIFWFEGMGTYKNISAHIFEVRVGNDIGLDISYEDLLLLGDQMDQIIWIYIVGSEKEITVDYKNGAELFKESPVVLHMFDSTFWELIADAEVVKIVKKGLDDKYLIKYNKRELDI